MVKIQPTRTDSAAPTVIIRKVMIKQFDSLIPAAAGPGVLIYTYVVHSDEFLTVQATLDGLVNTTV